jgi:TolB-like protein
MRNPLGAQRRQEFTQQGMLVSPFKSTDRKLGNHVADEIRGRVDKTANKRELEVIDEKAMTTALFNAGFPGDLVPELSQVRALSRYLRADEYLMGTVDRTAAGVRVRARLILRAMCGCSSPCRTRSMSMRIARQPASPHR